jgi:hypothetical protein
MVEKKRAYLRAQPSIIDFGPQYVGAKIQGSVQVLGATSCDRYHSPE